MVRGGAYAGTLLADPDKGIEMILKDGKIYKNTLDWRMKDTVENGNRKEVHHEKRD